MDEAIHQSERKQIKHILSNQSTASPWAKISHCVKQCAHKQGQWLRLQRVTSYFTSMMVICITSTSPASSYSYSNHTETHKSRSETSPPVCERNITNRIKTYKTWSKSEKCLTVLTKHWKLFWHFSILAMSDICNTLQPFYVFFFMNYVFTLKWLKLCFLWSARCKM